MSRRLLWVSVLPLVLVVGVRIVIQSLINQRVQSQNITFDEARTFINTLIFHNVKIGGHTVQSATVQLIPPQVIIKGASVDLSQIITTDTHQSTESIHDVTEHPAWLPVKVTQIQLQLPFIPDPVLVEGIVYPKLKLAGPQIEVKGDLSNIEMDVTTPIEIKGLNGKLNLKVHAHDSLSLTDFEGSLSNIRFSHPILASKPIQISKLDLDGQFKEGKLDISLSTDQSQIQLSTDLNSEIQYIDLQNITVHLSDLADWWALTERRKCTLLGEINATGQLTWPELDWSLELKNTPLQTECRLFDSQAFQKGVFSFMPLNQKQLRNTGPSTPYWSTNLGWLRAAACAAEDSQFFQHNGIDLKGIQDVLDAHDHTQTLLRGGSTITQQLAKNLFTGNERTLHRKLRELIYALELERTLSKDEILRLYLNIVEFGPNIYGIKAASEAYFVKSPAQLLPEEAAYLAALLPSPLSGYQEATKRQLRPFQVNRILTNMKDMELLSEQEFQAARQRKLIVVPQEPSL